MDTSQENITKYAQETLKTYNLSSFPFFDHSIAIKDIANDLIVDLEDLNSKETKDARHNYFQIKHTQAKDYQEREYSIDEDKKFIHGIRHFGGDPNLPFINIIPNFKIKNKDEALNLYRLIQSYYEEFKPLSICFHSREKMQCDFIGSIYMVASIDTLLKQKSWSEQDKISFQDIKDDSYYDWYARGYDEFHRERPDLKDKVRTNSLDSMKESMNQGLLKYVLLEGTRIGLISGEKCPFLGHSAIYFHEIFISKEFKGQGLAKKVQRSFIQNYCSSLKFVWGTINDNNLPSYKTAYSNGRRPIRYENFIHV